MFSELLLSVILMPADNDRDKIPLHPFQIQTTRYLRAFFQP